MFGLYYAIIGLVSGTICSLIANKKSRSQKDWFTMGQVLPGLSILILLLLSTKGAKYSNPDAEKLPVYPADIDSLATL
ncbi:MAG: hypothetical protein A2499_09115 [Stygiobacter sp. RIFOXYC12_FULL_38_8]|nr:MAG: hypothetical protein A2X62_16890 [Stygiobacter sp. GWC2_38_9]OGU77913.1 MAG: hypothetical protein A2279_02890 [Stygiobacter sp. RIFOXYA12_FULL_38_9]OGV09036.1 MAG: hypothetical protein A2299_11435 [Stygiobacter sp. RIFOXYB2_FULL_37_11]OGV14149.1 MAG: hypothetical protein A2237_13435 [Stygiobacter sp. RIFOXYA2_FULL_38_8]OGV16262.1 MAG: hypothetical protein A2440_04340 [Stygiobacter sp. RIFOXYC2_FULL_38_25]OGV28615.1 MAG: hypothetical protein A2499_09115 [Stygiobacter sp. RIFOXYC12_FULL_